MADIELVVKVPEKVYNALTHTEFDANLVVDEMRKSIANGTPLPKGHGRLKDENEIKQMIEDADVKNKTSKILAENIVRYASTIIEADKAEREGE